jgi:lycopene beta-cyclase
MNDYDYIIAGCGAGGLSLIVHMIHSGKFTDKKILLVDRAQKNTNDRTWCFWESKPGLFEPVVYKRWHYIKFYGDHGRLNLQDIYPYQYKMIRGIDFYQYCFSLINQQSNISVEYADIESIHSDNHHSFISIGGRLIHAQYIFSSINSSGNPFDQGRYFLWQHFKGWFINTRANTFNPDQATLMDFRIEQHNDTRFVYVMPFDAHNALVEYTVFSETRLSDEEYSDGLTDYCKTYLNLDANDFTIANEEFGMIPMTNRKFPQSYNRIIYIGSAGGQTKASSGYTFRFIQKHSEQLVNALIKNGSPYLQPHHARFTFYDSILLNILSGRKLPGSNIFTQLFEKNKMTEVFKFLDNETSIGEEIELISTLPKNKFINAAFRHLLHL